jgi:eukaryotic-like serine/threonine-protein kinase
MLPLSAQAQDQSSGPLATSGPESLDSPQGFSVLGERYVLQAEIARGSAASIYRALDRESGRTVALRIFNQRFQADPRFAVRFRRRMALIAGLFHENLVAVMDYGVLDGRYFIAMEWISGVDLRTYLVEHAPLSSGLAAFIAVQVCNALDAVHHGGLEHRGIKPQNVLLTGAGDIKVSDVGLSGLYSESGLSRTNVMVEGVGFMSPEQARGEDIGPPSDIYSVGILLYEMLTNRLPFESNDAWEVLRMHVNEQPPTPRRFNSAISADLATVVLTALQKEPARRYASAGEMAEALAPFQDSEQLKRDAAFASGAERGLLARFKNHDRLYALAKFVSGPAPAPLQRLPFGVLLAAFFAIGLAASFLVFYILLGLIAR